MSVSGYDFIFFFQEAFKYVQSCGNAFVPSYVPIVNKNKNKGMWKTTHAFWSVTDGKVSKVLSIRFSHLVGYFFYTYATIFFPFLGGKFLARKMVLPLMISYISLVTRFCVGFLLFYD
jgi:hypothetical protein